MRLRLLAGFAACLALGTACSAELDLGSAPFIECASTRDCPEGMLCNPNSGLCVDDEAPDFVAPGILDVLVSPAVAGPSSTLTVTLTTDEPLGQPPAISLRGSRRDRSLSLSNETSAMSGGTTFELTLSVDAELREDVDHVLVADLVDAAGNPATIELDETVRFDFSGPQVKGAFSSVVPDFISPLGTIGARLGRDVTDGLKVAAPGTTIVLGFELDEVVNDPAGRISVRAERDDGTAFDFARVVERSGPVKFVFARVVDGTVAAGDYRVSVIATDDLGNTNEVESEDVLTIDLTAPLAPDTTTSGRVTHERRPWGTATMSPGSSVLGVVGAAGAIADDAAYVIATRKLGLDAPVVGAGAVSSGGAFAFPLDAPDRAKLYLYAVDAAGNRSAPAWVGENRLVSTLGAKLAGSTYENPNIFTVAPVFDDALAHPGQHELGATDGLDAVECDVSACADDSEDSAWTASAADWAEPIAHRDTGYPPTVFVPRDYMAVGFDPVSERVIAYGGFVSGVASYGSTFAFDQTNWTFVTGGGPAGRRGAAMALDENLGKLVLFGGQQTTLDALCTGASSYKCNDLWQWNGSSWSTVAVSGGSPPHRAFAAMAFDSTRDRLVLFGGEGTAGRLADTWELNCTASPCTWTQIAGGGPSARSQHAMVYFDVSPTSRGVLLTGGDAGAGPLADVWLRNDTTWSSVSAAQGTTMGRPLSGHSLLWDAARGQVLSWGLPHNTPSDGRGCQRPELLTSRGELACPSVVFGPAPLQTGDSYAVFDPSASAVITFSRSFEPTATYVYRSEGAARPVHQLQVPLGDSMGGGLTAQVGLYDFAPKDALTAPGWTHDFGTSFPADALDPVGGRYGWTCTVFNPSAPATIPLTGTAATAGEPPERLSYVDFQFEPSLNTSHTCIWRRELAAGDYVIVGWLRDVDDQGVAARVSVEGTLVDVPAASASALPFAIVVNVADGELTLAAADPNPGDGIDPDTAVAALAIFRMTKLDELTIRWDAGSSSTAAGVELLAWNGVAWRQLALDTNTAGMGTSVPVVYTTNDPFVAGRYILGGARTLTLALTPAGDAGTIQAGARLMTDYVEVTSRFRLAAP